jgi:hypothetical protein
MASGSAPLPGGSKRDYGNRRTAARQRSPKQGDKSKPSQKKGSDVPL